MPDTLTTKNSRLVQASGSNTGKLRTDADRASFQNNVKADFAALYDQHNNLVYPLFSSLRSGPNQDDAVEHGIEGRTVTTYGDATQGSSACYWDSVNSRPRSIKETVDYLLSEIASVENAISLATSSSTDTSTLEALVDCLRNDITQLTGDTLGPDYVLGCSGTAELTWSLARHVHELFSQLVVGGPGLGVTFSGEPAYPALSLSILLSQITIDTTIPPSIIDSVDGGGATLADDLSAIHAFVGMDDASDTSPDYSAHGAISTVADGDSLEEAIQKLDAAVAGAGGDNLGNHTATQNLDMGGFAVTNVGTVDGVDVSAHAARHIRGGADEIDGDQLDIDWNPSNYTPVATPIEVTHVDHLTAHLAGIDNHVGDTGNPHSVTATQVGKDTAQWNADELQGQAISASTPTEGQVLVHTGGTWTPTTVIIDELTATMIPIAHLARHHATEPTQSIVVKGATASTEVAAQALEFKDGAEVVYVSCPVPVPSRVDGHNPSQLRLVGSFYGKIASASNAVFEAWYSTNTDVDIVGDNNPFVVTWGNGDKQVFSPDNTNVRVVEFDWVNVVSTADTGYIHVRLHRNPTDAGDLYADSVFLIGLQAQWNWD